METQHDKRKKQTRQPLQPLAVSIEGAAQLTSLSCSTIERLVRQGKFPASRRARKPSHATTAACQDTAGHSPILICFMRPSTGLLYRYTHARRDPEAHKRNPGHAANVICSPALSALAAAASNPIATPFFKTKKYPRQKNQRRFLNHHKKVTLKSKAPLQTMTKNDS